MGGSEGIRRLVDRFYDLVDSAPEAATIRKLHAASLKQSREKLHSYLNMWTGGPQTYVEQHGHPRLRARHLPFTISSRERDEWLWCMDRARERTRDAGRSPGRSPRKAARARGSYAEHSRCWITDNR
jgi:hemoglobin